jgi:hypothetical protein
MIVRSVDVDAMARGLSPLAVIFCFGPLIGPDDIEMTVPIGTDLWRKRAMILIQLEGWPKGRPEIPGGAEEDVLLAIAMLGLPNGGDVALAVAVKPGTGEP